jgi:hypothetical protein
MTLTRCLLRPSPKMGLTLKRGTMLSHFSDEEEEEELYQAIEEVTLIDCRRDGEILVLMDGGRLQVSPADISTVLLPPKQFRVGWGLNVHALVRKIRRKRERGQLWIR